MHRNPCQRCGACCALYKVPVLNWETNEQPGGTVPVEMMVLSGHKRVMKGTQGFTKRCAALSGTIGVDVSCLVYDRRPSACRSFQASWETACDGNPLCDRARASYGLAPYGN